MLPLSGTKLINPGGSKNQTRSGQFDPSSLPAYLPHDVRAADAGVDELGVAVGGVVDDRDADAEDGDIQLPLNALVLAAHRHLATKEGV